MDILIYVILIGIGVPLLALAGLSITVHRVIERNSRPDLGLTEIDETDSTFAEPLRYSAEYHPWAEEQGLIYVGSYLFNTTPPAFIAAWQHREAPKFLCIYYIKEGQTSRYTFDVVTMFSKDIGLTTGSSKDGHFFPRRSTSYVQTFSDQPVDELFHRHSQAERFLGDIGRVRMEGLKKRFEDTFVDAVREQMDHVRTIPLWPLRATWWLLTRRSRWHDMSIEQQHKAGWIKLPNELVAEQTRAGTDRLS